MQFTIAPAQGYSYACAALCANIAAAMEFRDSCVSRERPSFCMRYISVVRGSPSRSAAPWRPPTTQLVSSRVWAIAKIPGGAPSLIDQEVWFSCRRLVAGSTARAGQARMRTTRVLIQKMNAAEVSWARSKTWTHFTSIRPRWICLLALFRIALTQRHGNLDANRHEEASIAGERTEFE
jgi:hypothetical protein